jgi:plasmid stabilization system protein ParE
VIHPVSQRPRTRLDLLEQFVYLGERSRVEVAERYFAAVEETCVQLVTTLKAERPANRESID